MKIAVWYHCVFTGERIPSEDNAIAIACEQMDALKQSGLADAADEIHVGVNGGERDALNICEIMPVKSVLHLNPGGQSELATMKIMRDWLKPGWAVLYHHIKGIQHPMHHGFHNWRRSMERVCVWRWRTCVNKLIEGYETVGAHWLLNPMPGQKYWAGNFWWATSEYLMTLPPFDPDTHERRYEAEVWIGKSDHYPKLMDFFPKMPLH